MILVVEYPAGGSDDQGSCNAVAAIGGWFAGSWARGLVLNDFLFKACSDGDYARVRKLLNAGADINAREIESETPLMYAAVEDRTEVVKLLLDRGAEINLQSVNRETALGRAVGMSRYEAVSMLLDRGANIEQSTEGGGTPLMDAAGLDDLKMLKLLLARGAKVNVTDDEGDTALMAAVVKSVSSDTVRFLLASGADVNLRNKRGEIPATIAERNGNQALLALLRTR